MPRSSTSSREPLIVVVDDDVAVRDSLDSLFRFMGMQARLFGSPDELLESQLPDISGRLIPDVRLPGISGLDFRTQLARHGINLPIVFMTGVGTYL